MKWIILLFFIIIILIIYYFGFFRERYHVMDDFYNPLQKMWIYYNILSEQDCDDIIATAKQIGLTKSEVKNFEFDTKSRISETCWIDPDKNATVSRLYDRIENMFHRSKKDFEMLQVVKYNRDGFFTWHYDQCNDQEEWCKNEISRLHGYRLFTILIYLNDDYENGETVFKNKKKYKFKKGDALIFRNVNLDNCSIEYDNLHTGSKITRGEKWICNIWIRGYCDLKKS